MFNKKIIILVMLIVVVFILVFVQNMIMFNGKIYDQVCMVQVNGFMDIIIDLGNYSKECIVEKGVIIDYVLFIVSLVSCLEVGIGVLIQVMFCFYGVIDDFNLMYFKNVDEGLEMGVVGVGIFIQNVLYSDVIDNMDDVVVNLLIDGLIVDFIYYVVMVNDGFVIVIGGDVSIQVMYIVLYQ